MVAASKNCIDIVNLTPAQVAEAEIRDKRLAVIHEAGHATACIAFGCFGCAHICRNEQGGLDEKYWTGQFRWPTSSLDKSARAVVAIAGVVAEEMADNPDLDVWGIMDFLNYGVIIPSRSDLDYFPLEKEDQFVAVEKALSILREKQSLTDRIAAQLLEYEVVLEHDMVLFSGSIPRSILEQIENLDCKVT